MSREKGDEAAVWLRGECLKFALVASAELILLARGTSRFRSSQLLELTSSLQ